MRETFLLFAARKVVGFLGNRGLLMLIFFWGHMVIQLVERGGQDDFFFSRDVRALMVSFFRARH